MFTGLVQGLGEVLEVKKSTLESRFNFKPLFKMEKLTNGESIAVNGVCLSVESHTDASFTAYASAETLRRTTLAELRTGSRANLERALAFGERLGGHLVSGHVDCVATVTNRAKSGQSVLLRLNFPAEFAPEVVAKGSVALDGISLTVNNCGKDFLEINVIPDTQKRTNMSSWQIGSRVNMETDLIGKYVLNIMRYGTAQETAKKQPLSRDFLSKNGFV